MSVTNHYQKYFNELHEQARHSARQFVKKEILPFVDDWEEQGEFPRELYLKAADQGLLSVGYPESVGGTPGDLFLRIAIWEELMGCTSGGIAAGLGSLHIALPPIVKYGSMEQKKRFVCPVLAGEKIAALAITESGAGSDVANLQTKAVRRGQYYVVNGSKTFITSGIRADQITCAVRTGGPGVGGISFLIIEAKTPGYSVSSKLKKMCWWASDTAEIFFEDCRVPVENLIGKENQGFSLIMENFEMERLQLAIMANRTAELAFKAAKDYAEQRHAFGKPLKGFQVTRHKLVDMATLLEVSREFTYRVAAKIQSGEKQNVEIAMAKNFACQVSSQITDQAVQIFGGYGLMRESTVERLYRDNRLLSIGGGTTEIMKEIIAKALL